MHETPKTWGELGRALQDVLDNTWTLVWDLQCGWQVAEAAVQGFAKMPWRIGWDMSSHRGWITWHQEDPELGAERNVAAALQSRLLPQYCIILGVAIMDAFVTDIRRLFPRKQRPPRGLFGLPVPPGIPKAALDTFLSRVVPRGTLSCGRRPGTES